MLKDISSIGRILKKDEQKKIKGGSSWTCVRTKPGHQSGYFSGDLSESTVSAWSSIWASSGWDTHCYT